LLDAAPGRHPWQRGPDLVNHKSPVTDFIPQLSTFLQVVLIDVALSGDNAIVIALAAAGLPTHQRRQAIVVGIGAAIAMRVMFALGAVYLLEVPGLLLIGGLMLVWVCVKMWREIRSEAADEAHHVRHEPKTIQQAVLQITVADVSMSLDNVLAVAGAAHAHAYIMAAGLLLAICMMGVAASAIAPLLKRWPWLNYAGLALIVFVAGRMIAEGGLAVAPMVAALYTGRSN
jgi:YjbE family integral membrane protein